MRLRVKLLWEPRDCRVGVCWRRYSREVDSQRPWGGRERGLEFFVCLVPCLPLRLTFWRREP